MDRCESLERAFDLRGTPANTRRVYTEAVARFEEFFDDRPAWELGRAQSEPFGCADASHRRDCGHRPRARRGVPTYPCAHC